MRSPFTIWSDDGRVDYGVERPKFPRAKRFGVAVVAFAVVGLGVWNAYSAIVANLKAHDSTDVHEAANRQVESHDPVDANREAANRPADANRDAASRDPAEANRETARSAANEAPAINAGRPTMRSFAAKTRVKPHTLGLVPLGAPDRSAVAEPRRVAGAEANPVAAPVDQSTPVPPERSDRGAANEASPINASRPTRSFAAKSQVKPHTLGPVSIGAPDRSAITGPRRVAGADASLVVEPADQSTPVPPERSDRGAVKPEENRLREKSRVANRKPARGSTTIQVYDLPDGRRLVVGPVRNDSGRAGGTDFGRPGGTDFDGRDDVAPVPRVGPRIRVAWPWFFGMPF